MPRSNRRKTSSSRRASGGGRAGGRGRPRSRSRGGPGPRPLLRAALVVIGAVAFVAGVATSILVVRLDRIVTDRFEGQRFQVPSVVYSAPAILYPGLDVELADLRGSLVRLGYRESPGNAGDVGIGHYRWGRDEVRVHLRAFEHPTRSEPSRSVAIELRGGAIEDIRELPGGRTLSAVLLEPEQLGAYYGSERAQRELVSIDEVPQQMVDAVLAVEDQRFISHPGVDLRRIVGAMFANVRAGSIRQGGSTLTQQLVKNFFLTPERTFERKAQEAIMALLVELRYDKREILEAYLNEIYFGQRGATAIHGVGEASRRFFGERPRNLSLAESALLAALIQSPNGISPYRNPEGALSRRNLVLDLMEDQGRISHAEHDEAVDEAIHLAAITPDPGDARYFLDVLRTQLSAGYDHALLASQGMRIYSTLERRTQRLAGIALREGLAELESRHPELASDDPERALQGCIVALRPGTGEIVALVGGRDYGVSQFDRCTQARRQAGSAFKPFVYIAALEPRTGGPAITLASLLDDSPLEVQTTSGPWTPQNFDKEFHDTVSVREAIERSLNVATARLAQDIGVGRVADVARRMGIESRLPLVPSLALGAAEVSPLELARAYATLASGGVRPQVHAIEDLVDREGNTLERRRLHLERAIDPGTAYLTTSLLEGVADRGTGAAVRATGLRGPIAAKTGTTDDERDLWFVGYTPEIVALVWVGFDEPRSVGLVSSRVALPIWRRFVTELTGGSIRGRFAVPSSIREADIEPATGALAVWGCPDRRRELFIEGTLPSMVCPAGEIAGAEEGGFRRTRRLFFDWLRKHL